MICVGVLELMIAMLAACTSNSSDNRGKSESDHSAADTALAAAAACDHADGSLASVCA